MGGEYYCEFCNEPIVGLLHMCEKKYDCEVAKHGVTGQEEDTLYWREDIAIGKEGVDE